MRRRLGQSQQPEAPHAQTRHPQVQVGSHARAYGIWAPLRVGGGYSALVRRSQCTTPETTSTDHKGNETWAATQDFGCVCVWTDGIKSCAGEGRVCRTLAFFSPTLGAPNPSMPSSSTGTLCQMLSFWGTALLSKLHLLLRRNTHKHSSFLVLHCAALAVRISRRPVRCRW